MKCQTLLSRNIKKNIISLSSAEFAHSMVNVNTICERKLIQDFCCFFYSGRFSQCFFFISCPQKWLNPYSANHNCSRRHFDCFLLLFFLFFFFFFFCLLLFFFCCFFCFFFVFFFLFVCFFQREK